MPLPFSCHSGGSQSLKACLRRITDTKPVSVSAEHLSPILEASHDADERREIMRHLRESLSEPTGRRWQRIYAGLLLVEKLMEGGSRDLMVELAHGYHFDLLQKVALLEHFDSTARCVTNPWAQGMVRKKATELRGVLAPRLQQASVDELPPGAAGFFSEKLPALPVSCSGSTSATCSTAASSSSTSPESLSGLTPRRRLQSELKRIAELGVSDVPPELFTFAVEASYDPAGRREIVRHMQGCLADSGSTDWQQVYAGLMLVENVVQRGSPQIVTEAAEAFNFNLARQIWLLQEFDHGPDWRAQNLVRKKAAAVHGKVVHRLHGAAGEDPALSGGPAPISDAFADLRPWLAESDSSSCSPSDRLSVSSSGGPPGSPPYLRRR